MKWCKNTVYELLIVIISAFSVILNFYLFKDWRGILYYTILSNVLVLLFYSITLIKKARGTLKKNNFYFILKGLTLISILCTMFMYNFFLAKGNNVYTGHPIISSTVHIIVPLMVLIDCIIFGRSNVLKYKYIIFWEITLIAYYIFINIYSILGGKFLGGKKYPYDLINFEMYGIYKVIANCIMILIIYAVLGLCIVKINTKMKHKKIVGESNER